jgi:predicted molibdopterin-dependent oxidoreductase YjgC
MQEGEKIEVTVDGKQMFGYEGEPIAAMLSANGIKTHRYTKKNNSPRGVFCAIGRCTDCVMVVDGVPNVRTCVTPLRSGMKIETQKGAGYWGENNEKC